MSVIDMKSQKPDQVSIQQVDDDKTIRVDSRLDSFKKWKNKMFGDVYADNDPKEMSMSQKYVYVFVVALLGINATITILIYMPGIYAMMDELNTSITGIDATVAIYIAFTGISVSCIDLPYFKLTIV